MSTRQFGEKVQRREDPRLLTGNGRYLDDLGRGSLEAAFVRSPHAHARVVHVDIDDAWEVDGVEAIYTWEDLTGRVAEPLPVLIPHPALTHPRVGYCLAKEEVNHVGEAVVMVVARNRYLGDSVNTASPQRLVVMLYDGLVQDLQLAQQGLARGDLALVHARLVRAQAIVVELQTSLDLDAWDGARSLHDLYTYVRELLVDANVRKAAEPITDALAVVEPLQDAWRQALGATS